MITLEGVDLIILNENPEKESIEVVDNGTLFKGKVFEMTCESEIHHQRVVDRHQKITLYDYSAKPLPKGYIEKRAIEKGLDKINNGTYCMDKDFNECVNVIYETLIGEGVLK